MAGFLKNSVLNPARILIFRGYTFLSGFITFLVQSYFKSNGNPFRILENPI
jgi:hypothetical protein